MAKTSVYIQEEDEYLWKQINNKSQWIHEHLTGEVYFSSKDIDTIIKKLVQEELDKREQEYG